MQTAVRRALENRTDVLQSKKQLESNDIAIRSLRDQTLPQLDLNVNYGLAGVGGPQFVRSGLGGAVSATIPGGFSDALSSLANVKAPSWNLSVTMNYPLGDRKSTRLNSSHIQKSRMPSSA